MMLTCIAVKNFTDQNNKYSSMTRLNVFWKTWKRFMTSQYEV